MNHGRYKVTVKITGKNINDTVIMDYYPTEEMTVQQVAERFACWDADGSEILSVKRVA